MIESNMNEHVRKYRLNDDRIHVECRYRERNKAAKRVLDFTSVYNLSIVNNIFRKRNEHYTY